MGLLSKAVVGTPDNSRASENIVLKQVYKKNQDRVNSALKEANKDDPSSSRQENALIENLSAGYSKFGMFQGIVIESIKNSVGEFYSRLSSMVSGFGIAQSLAPGRALVLFDSGQDGELIGIHLAKTVPGNNIFYFQANNPKEAFSVIKPYL